MLYRQRSMSRRRAVAEPRPSETLACTLTTRGE